MLRKKHHGIVIFFSCVVREAYWDKSSAGTIGKEKKKGRERGAKKMLFEVIAGMELELGAAVKDRQLMMHGVL